MCRRLTRQKRATIRLQLSSLQLYRIHRMLHCTTSLSETSCHMCDKSVCTDRVFVEVTIACSCNQDRTIGLLELSRISPLQQIGYPLHCSPSSLRLYEISETH